MTRVRLVAFFSLVVPLLAGCGVHNNSRANVDGYGIKPSLLMSTSYIAETKTLRYIAERSGAYVPNEGVTAFYGDGDLLVDFKNSELYWLDRQGAEADGSVTASVEFRGVSPAIVSTQQMHAVAADAVPDTISLAQGFVIGWAGDPLVEGERFEIVIRNANESQWGYGDAKSLNVEGNKLVVAPHAEPNMFSAAIGVPPPGEYEVAIQRSTADSRTVGGFLVVTGATYWSTWTALTIVP